MTSTPRDVDRAAHPAAARPAPTAYRVLITGSRTWRDHAPIHAELDAILTAHPGMILVHGSCRDGVDAIADRWATLRGVQVERHPAEWRRYQPASPRSGNPAGFIRNEAMVARGANICLAFIAPCAKPGCRKARPHGSHGAEHCAETADAAGIPVHPHRAWDTTTQLALEDT